MENYDTHHGELLAQTSIIWHAMLHLLIASIVLTVSAAGCKIVMVPSSRTKVINFRATLGREML
jgi:hypothetical protein